MWLDMDVGSWAYNSAEQRDRVTERNHGGKKCGSTDADDVMTTVVM